MSASGGVTGEAEDLGELVLDRAGFGEHAVGSGPAAAGLVEQDGLADPGEFAEQGAEDRSRPARAAARRMRWAICRARTQVKTWTRMLCSVQWRIGEKNTTRVSLSWRKENSASDRDRYPATTSGTGQSSWPVISTCLPK